MAREALMTLGAWAARTAREFALQDWIVLGYLAMLVLLAVVAPPQPDRRLCIERTGMLFATCAAVVIAVRGSILSQRFLGPFLYRVALLGGILFSYFLLRRLMPMVNHAAYDAQLLAIDEKLFGVEPVVWMDRFVTPATTEWFAFFYFGHFFLLAVHILPLLFLSRRTTLLAEFSLGLAVLFSVSHLLYMVVPGYGPYHFMGNELHPLPQGRWFTMVLDTVNSGGALKDIFPSLHTGAPVFLVLFSLRHRDQMPFRYSWPFTLFFTANIVIATVFLRWHYAIDVIAGVALSIAASAFAARVSKSEVARRRERGLQPVWQDLLPARSPEANSELSA